MKIFSDVPRFAKNLKWQFLGNAMQALLGGLYIVFMGRVLGAKDFGIFSSILAIVSVLGLIGEFRIQDVVAKLYCNLDEENYIKNYNYNALLNLIILDTCSKFLPFIIVFITIDHIDNYIDVGSNKSLILLYSFCWIFLKSGSSVAQGIFRAINKNNINTYMISFEWGLKLLVSIIFNLFSDLDVYLSIYIYILIGIIANLIQNTILFIEINKKMIYIPYKNINFSSFYIFVRNHQLFLLSNFIVSLTNIISKDMDVVIVNYFIGSTNAGIYKLAKTGSYMIWRAVDPFYSTILPEIQKLYQNNNYDGIKLILFNTTKIIFLYTVVISISANLVVYFGLDFFLGKEYYELPFLMMQMTPWILFCGPLIWANPLAIAINKPQYPSYGGLIGMAAGLIMYALLLPLYGLVGAAIAWNSVSLISYCFVVFCSLRDINSH